MRNSFFACLLAAAFCSTASAQEQAQGAPEKVRPERCHGIALSDATDYGPFQAGALIGLLKHQQKIGEHYDVVTGVGLGALNAFILATHANDEYSEAIESIDKFWSDLSEIEPYSSWPGGFVFGFFFEKGIYSAANIESFIDKNLGARTVQKHLNLAITNVLNGQFTVFDESYSTADLTEVLKASVAYSGISPAVEFDGQLYFSGDAIYENDVLSIINYCEALGYAESDIVIDTIISGSKNVQQHFNPSGANAYQVLKRSSYIFKYYGHMHGIMRAKDGHRDVNFRYVLGPSVDLPSKILPLQYSKSEASSLLKHGERDAERQIHSMLYNMDEEIEKRLRSPMELRFHNKDRQKKQEEAIKSSMTSFLQAERAKLDEALNDL